MKNTLDVQLKSEKIPIAMVSTLPSEVKQFLISDEITFIKDLIDVDPFHFSTEYGLDIQTTMLAFREASILQSRRIPSLVSFPQSPILFNISYLPSSDNRIWIAGLTTGVSILHWLSFSYEVDEEIILKKLEFHLVPLAENRPVICISQIPNSLEIVKEKAEAYGLEFLSSVLKEKTLDFSKFLGENVLWHDENRFESILQWLGYPFGYNGDRAILFSEEVARDLYFYGNLRKKTALEAVQYSVDLFEAIDYFKDRIVAI